MRDLAHHHGARMESCLELIDVAVRAFNVELDELADFFYIVKIARHVRVLCHLIDYL